MGVYGIYYKLFGGVSSITAYNSKAGYLPSTRDILVIITIATGTPSHCQGLVCTLKFFSRKSDEADLDPEPLVGGIWSVTQDQANVYFESMLLYSVQNESEDTIKKVAFKFIGDRGI